MASILATADKLEQQIREYLAANPGGGRFDIPNVGMDYMAIPVMIGVFEEEGWVSTYEFDNDSQWLEIEKASPVLIGYEG